jgi:hypothetical protein
MTSAQTRPHVSLTSSQQQWLRVRNFLGDYRYELGSAARSEYPEVATIGPTPLLAADRWMPPMPMNLDEVALKLDPSGPVVAASNLAELAPPVVLPQRLAGSRYESTPRLSPN